MDRPKVGDLVHVGVVVEGALVMVPALVTYVRNTFDDIDAESLTHEPLNSVVGFTRAPDPNNPGAMQWAPA